VKLPADRAGLPGKVISFYIVPLDPAYPARAGRGTLRPKGAFTPLEDRRLFNGVYLFCMPVLLATLHNRTHTLSGFSPTLGLDIIFIW
jgi:hypothetical protein